MASNGSAHVHELQTRIRDLEAQRKSRSDEASRIIASQRATIDRLRAENQRLSGDLASVGSTDAAAIAAMVATGSVVSTIIARPAGLTPAQAERTDKLIEVADTYSRKIDVEQRQLESLEREVELAQAQLLAARRDIGGHSGTQAVSITPVKAIKALETRLEVTQRRFNEHIAANRDLKQQIDAATRRQAGREQVRAQLEREVAATAAELLGVQEATRIAQEAKQEALAQVAALRVSEDSEAAAFELEIRELAACQAADEKLLQAQAARLTKSLEAAEADDGAEGGAEPLDLDSLEQGIGVEAAAVQLQRAAGLSSLPETLDHYKALEQRSFDLFSSCNEANERIQAMTREARELEAEVRQLETDVVAGRQHDAIRQVLGRRDAALRRADSLAERRGALDRRVAMLRTGIYTCLRKLGAAAAAQAWEASAPSATSQHTRPDSNNGAPSANGGGAPSTPSASPIVAACAHVMAGLALLEQRAAAIIAVQGTLVGRSSSLSRVSGSGSAGSGSRPTSALPSSTASSSRPKASLLAGVAATVAAGRTSAGARSTSGNGNGGPGGGGGGVGDEVELIDDSEDEEDEMPLTREQIQARSASMHRL